MSTADRIPTPGAEPALYDIDQITALLNKSRATINRFRRLGQFPAESTFRNGWSSLRETV